MDDNDDKPFACTAEGCGMRFTNEDHLTVHKKKHEMSLNLSASNSIKSNSNVFVDQTPTPTRFIRNCEEVGLFQDLQNVNPFDEQFKKAVEISKSSGNNISEQMNGSSDSDTLNTPSVLPNVLDNDLVVSTTTCTDNGDILPQTRSSSLRNQSSSAQPSSTTVDSDDEEVCVISAHLDGEDNLSSGSSLTGTNTFLSSETRVIMHGQSSTTSLVTQSPLVSTATSHSSQVLQIPTVASTAEASLTSSLPATTAVAQPTPVIASATTVVQLLLKLPDGRSVPVQIPAVPVVSSPASVVSVAQCGAATSTITSLAKMKLKETLIQNQQSCISTISSSNLHVITDAVEFINSAEGLKSEDCESLSSPEQRSQMVSKRRRTSEEDPDEKRRRFLERNRAAATRCRLKRKHWIQQLEKKADDLSSTNSQLLTEVKMLRNEVAHLKTLLLAHKDCPVTLQQHAVTQIEASQQNHIILDNVKTIQITSAEAIASTALTNMAHTIATDPAYILPVDVVIDSDPVTLEGHIIQDNSNNDIDK